MHPIQSRTAPITDIILPIGPLVSGPKPVAREATRRKNEFLKKTIEKEHLVAHLAQGWQSQKVLATKVHLRKLRPHDEILENQVWRILYLMGYPELNSGRGFTIEIQRKGENVARKQIDVFAKDDETIIVGECKSCQQLTKRSLQKDIDEFANLKGPIATAIRRHYGTDFRPKIIWMFFTHNILWSQPDIQRAATQNIRVVTERELPYFNQIADHLRHAARYQFLGEFLKDQEVPELANKKVPAIRGKLAGRHFYCFTIKAQDLLKIAFINHRSLNDPDGAPSYQRLVSRTRLKQVRTFLEKGGFFPNNLLVNFSRKVRFEPISKADDSGIAYGNLTLPNRYRSAWIIDGQHRLYAFAGLQKKSKEANLIVVAFEGLRKEEEADLFVTINHEQKTVPKTLLDDLEGELKWGSANPTERIGALAARLIGFLNQDPGEPFHNRVTRQGLRPTDDVCLTVPSIKAALQKSGLLGRAQFNNQEYLPGPLSGPTDHATMERARTVLNGYFGSIRTANGNLWGKGRESFICTNTGVHAFILLLGQFIKFAEGESSMDLRQVDPEQLLGEINDYLDPILKFLSSSSERDAEVKFKVPYGSGGPPEYFFRLVSIIKETYSDFQPEGFEAWEVSQSQDRISEADRQIKEINIIVQRAIFAILRKEHGEEPSGYWEKGVKSREIKIKAYSKAQDHDVDKRLALENYLDFIEYKKIVEDKENWSLFKEFFDIPLPGEKGHAKNLKWMDRINDLRKISAHATESRKYQADDFEFLDWIFDHVERRFAPLEGVE